MVSNAREDFPLPLMPVITTSFSRGIRISIDLRLCSLAPMTSIQPLSSNWPEEAAVEVTSTMGVLDFGVCLLLLPAMEGYKKGNKGTAVVREIQCGGNY